MTTDGYTKLILTVIAGALVGLLVQNIFRPAAAQPDSCGKTSDTPCWIIAHQKNALPVVNGVYNTPNGQMPFPLAVKVLQ